MGFESIGSGGGGVGGGGGRPSKAPTREGGKSRGSKSATPQRPVYDSSTNYSDNSPMGVANIMSSPIVMEPNDGVFSDQSDFEPQLFQTYQPEIGGYGGFGDGAGMASEEFGRGGKNPKSGVRKYKDEAPPTAVKSLEDLTDEFEKCNDLFDDFF